MGLHSSHVPLAAARAHPAEVVLLSADTFHWPSFRPEGRRALYLARWHSGGAAALGVHMWASSSEALTAITSPQFFSPLQPPLPLAAKTRSSAGPDRRAGEVAGNASAGGLADEGIVHSKVRNESGGDESNYEEIAQRSFLMPAACAVTEAAESVQDPLAAWLGERSAGGVCECAVLLPLTSLPAAAPSGNGGSGGEETLTPLAYWPLSRPAGSPLSLKGGEHGNGNSGLLDVLGRFPARIYTLPDTTVGTGRRGSGWRWVRLAAGEAAAGEEEAGEAEEGHEEVLRLDGRGGLFLPIAV